MAKVYYKWDKNQQMDVPDFDVDYYKSQWWTTGSSSTWDWSNTLNEKQVKHLDNLNKRISAGYKPNTIDQENLDEAKNRGYQYNNQWTSDASNQKDSMQKIYDYIASLWLPEEYNAILKYVAEDPGIQKIESVDDFKKMINDASLSAEADLSPYYKKITGREIEDLKTSMADIRNQVSREMQQEQKSYGELLNSTKDNLRQRWLTFSWTSRATLGKEWALDDKEIEWSVPQQRRYDIEDYLAWVQETSRDIGTAAERNLWSWAISALNLWSYNSPYNGTDYSAQRTQPLYLASKKWQDWYVEDWDLQLDRLKNKEISKWDRIQSLRKNI